MARDARVLLLWLMLSRLVRRGREVGNAFEEESEVEDKGEKGAVR